jgi:hypothetical protein
MDDAMDELVAFRTDGSQARIIVATSADDVSGAQLISRRDGPREVHRTFEQSLEGARAAAEAALRVFRDGRLKPDSVEIEFGVKITAETGAVLVKGSAEGHLTVKLAWSPEPRRTTAGPAPTPSDAVPAPSDSASALAPSAPDDGLAPAPSGPAPADRPSPASVPAQDTTTAAAPDDTSPAPAPGLPQGGASGARDQPPARPGHPAGPGPAAGS